MNLMKFLIGLALGRDLESCGTAGRENDEGDEAAHCGLDSDLSSDESK